MTDNNPETEVNTLRKLLQQQWHTTDQKNKRTADTLHKEVGQLLTAAKLHLSLLEEKLDRLPKKSAGVNISGTVQKIDTLLDEVVGVIRSVTEELRVDLLENFGLSAAIEWKLDNSLNDVNVTVNTSSPETMQNKSGPAEQTMFYCFSRVIDELNTIEELENVEVQVCEDKLTVKVMASGAKANSKLENLESRTLLRTELSERMRLIQGEFSMDLNNNILLITFTGSRNLL